MRHRPFCFLCLAVFLLLCAAVFGAGERFLADLAPSALERWVKEDETVCFSGRVYQKEQREDYQILYLKNISMQTKEQSFQESQLMVYDDQKTELKIGSIVSGEGSVFYPEEARNPGNFDQKLYYRRLGLHGCVWASRVEVTESGGGLMEALYAFRQRWKGNLIKALGEKDGSVLAAILLGEKAGMDGQIKELYQDNGIGHILAISGVQTLSLAYMRL